MTAPADTDDPIGRMCDQLAAYLPRLARLLPDPDSPAGYADTGMTGALAHSPVPGNVPAFFALTGIHGLARWWVAMLLYHHGAADPWGRYGGSDEDTVRALKHIIQLAAGTDDEDVLGDLAAALRHAEADAGAVPSIDETQRWRHLRGRACPYCRRLATLKVLLDARGSLAQPAHIECFGAARASGERCLDGNGMRPSATIGTDAYGRVVLQWADGRTEIAPDLDAA